MTHTHDQFRMHKSSQDIPPTIHNLIPSWAMASGDLGSNPKMNLAICLKKTVKHIFKKLKINSITLTNQKEGNWIWPKIALLWRFNKTKKSCHVSNCEQLLENRYLFWKLFQYRQWHWKWQWAIRSNSTRQQNIASLHRGTSARYREKSAK